jgi:hypothetical protein
MFGGSSTTASTTAGTTKSRGGGKPVSQRTPESIECSKQADAQGLHGKERQSMRQKCMKSMAK